jgi:hypothetical protein
VVFHLLIVAIRPYPLELREVLSRSCLINEKDVDLKDHAVRIVDTGQSAEADQYPDLHRIERPHPCVDETKLLEISLRFGRSVGVTGLLGTHLSV